MLANATDDSAPSPNVTVASPLRRLTVYDSPDVNVLPVLSVLRLMTLPSTDNCSTLSTISFGCESKAGERLCGLYRVCHCIGIQCDCSTIFSVSAVDTSSSQCGTSLTGSIVTVTVVVDVSPEGSLTVYVKLSVVVSLPSC